MSTITIGWGKPTIKVARAGTNNWEEFATPVEDSTQLTTTQGDKMEARVEGGGNEAVRFNANTYELAFSIRQVPGRKEIIEDIDGVVPYEYSVCVTPENENAIGCSIQRAAVNVQVSYSAAEGVVKTYTFSTLKPGGNEPQVELKPLST